MCPGDEHLMIQIANIVIHTMVNHYNQNYMFTILIVIIIIIIIIIVVVVIIIITLTYLNIKEISRERCHDNPQAICFWRTLQGSGPSAGCRSLVCTANRWFGGFAGEISDRSYERCVNHRGYRRFECRIVLNHTLIEVSLENHRTIAIAGYSWGIANKAITGGIRRV